MTTKQCERKIEVLKNAIAKGVMDYSKMNDEEKQQQSNRYYTLNQLEEIHSALKKVDELVKKFKI